MGIDRVNTDKLLTTTRTVRKRMDFDRPVELSVIEERIGIALQVPSGLGNHRSTRHVDTLNLLLSQMKH